MRTEQRQSWSGRRRARRGWRTGRGISIRTSGRKRKEEYHDRVTREGEWLETIERKKEKAAKERADWIEEWEAIKANREKQNEWLKLEYEWMHKRDAAQRELYKINPSPPSPLTQ